MKMSKKTSSSDLKSAQRKRCFFDIDVSGNHAGRIIFELFNDICPKTCENFRALCTGEKGLGLTTNKKLYYKGSPIHRVVKGFIIQGGDFSNGDGTGGESIYGGCFQDEYLGGKHDKPFLLSMANRGKDTNGSQFFVTCAPAPHLDGKHVVFGHLVQGFEVIKLIENLPTDDKNRPLKHVNLAHCGELIMKIKKKRRSSVTSSSSNSSSSSDSSSGSSSTSSSSSESSSSESDSESEKEQDMITKDLSSETNVVPKQTATEEDVFCSIKPGEVPPIPENKFLMRRSNVQPTNQQVALGERENRNVDERQRERREDRRRTKDAAGRKVKGRGFLRFNMRRSRSRSRTPVHWRRAVYDRSRPERTDQKARTNSAPSRDYEGRDRRRSDEASREREPRKGRKSDNSQSRTSRHDRRSTSESKEPTKSNEKRSRSREERTKKSKHGSERRHRRRSTSRSREKRTSQRSDSKSQARSESESKRRSRSHSTKRKRHSRSKTRSRS